MHDYQALLEQVVTEDFENPIQTKPKSSDLKGKAAAYLGKDLDSQMSPTDFKRVRAKANKMKKSQSKATRAQGQKLSRQLSQIHN